MEQELRSRLFETAERLSSLTGMSEQTISQRAIKDNTFFKRVRENGAGFTVKTYDRLMEWMERELERAHVEAA
ncbi:MULTISPECIES: hypothetical protein [Chelativorans]|jgi:hypothetical protein|uniref:hypothetical protein n=1 Tax=Chelativorans TaxID=449972 RepID=UPI00003A366C|nr:MULTISPECIES: hypothetical protein [Chelativorans]